MENVSYRIESIARSQLVYAFGEYPAWRVHNAGKAPCDAAGRPLDGWQHNAMMFEQARGLLNEHAIGVGLVVAQCPYLVAVDLDDSINGAGGAIDAIAAAIVCNWHTYTEITPSGHGLRVYALLDGGEPVHIKRLIGGFTRELYYRATRFVCVTGDVYDDHDELNTISLDQLAEARRQIESGRLMTPEQELDELREICSLAPCCSDTLQSIDELETTLAMQRARAEAEKLSHRSVTMAGGMNRLANFVAGSNEGERNSRLYWSARRMVEQGRDAMELLTAAVATGLGEREALATINSAIRAGGAL